MLIKPKDILDLIAEAGHDVRLCSRRVTVAAQTEYGFPERVELVCRPVRGYVVSNAAAAGRFAIGQGALTQGDLTAYISAEDIQPEDLTPNTLIVWADRTYQVEIDPDIKHRGKTMLYQFTLKQTQQQTQNDQPDAILE